MSFDWKIAGLIAAGPIGWGVLALGYGPYMQYQAGQQAADAAEAAGEYNAKVAKNKAEQERLNRVEQERDEREASRRRRALIESMYARSGVLLSGTPESWLAEQAGTDELSILRGTYASRAQQRDLLSQSAFYRMQGQNEATGYRMQATSQAVSSLTQTAMSAAALVV